MLKIVPLVSDFIQENGLPSDILTSGKKAKNIEEYIEDSLLIILMLIAIYIIVISIIHWL